MVTSYSEKLEDARKNRKKRRGGLGLIALLTCALLILGIGYVNRIYISPILKTDLPSGTIERISGYGFLVGNYYIPIFGSSEVLIDYVGYEDYMATLSSADAGVYQPSLALRDKQLTLKVNGNVSSATWMINGTVVGFTEQLELSLTPGVYEVSFEGIGVEKITREIELLPDERPEDLTLLLADRLLNVNIRSKPSNAAVLIGDVLVGYTPLEATLDSAYSGKDVSLLLDKYNPVSFEIRPNNGVFEGEFTLEHKTSEVVLKLDPISGALIVNGEKIETESGEVKVKFYEFLDNTLSYSKFGYVPIDLVTPYSEVTSLNLEPITSYVSVDSSVPSIIKFDGFDQGETPVEFEAQIGVHTLSAERTGYITKTITFDVTEGEPSSFNFTMETLFDYRDRTSPPNYRNSIGQLLHKLKGTDMIIGAPPSQKGQRANEVLQSVGFVRQFYLAESEVSLEDYALYDSNFKASKKPVSGISWLDAVKFCNWLSEKEGYDPFYVIKGNSVSYDLSSIGYRLPTESEWEFAARLNGKRRETIFVWGDDYTISDVVGNIADATAEGTAAEILSNYNDGSKEPANVKSYSAQSQFYDLSGNVSEFVSDHYVLEPPVAEKKIDHINLSPSSQRVLKGSNYLSASWTELRASFREGIDINVGRSDVGFRIARYVH